MPPKLQYIKTNQTSDRFPDLVYSTTSAMCRSVLTKHHLDTLNQYYLQPLQDHQSMVTGHKISIETLCENKSFKQPIKSITWYTSLGTVKTKKELQFLQLLLLYYCILQELNKHAVNSTGPSCTNVSPVFEGWWVIKNTFTGLVHNNSQHSCLLEDFTTPEDTMQLTF